MNEVGIKSANTAINKVITGVTNLMKGDTEEKKLHTPSDIRIKLLEHIDGYNNRHNDLCKRYPYMNGATDYFNYGDIKDFHNTELMDAYNNLNSIVFKYNEQVKDIDPSQDTETIHSGISAQEVEQEPLLNSAVITDENTGLKMIDTREIATSNMAVISDIIKVIKELEDKVSSLMDKGDRRN